MKKFLLLLFLSSIAHAGDIVIGSFQGLNTQDSGLTLEDGEAQDLLNVRITPGGKSVYKREGYGLHKTLTFSTGPVHGLHYFQDSSGSDIQLYGHDIYLSASVNGGATVDLATGTVDATWQCTDNLGSAYCVTSSRDSPIITDGTSGGTSYNPSMPLGTMVTNTPDRLVIAGVSGAESSLYISKANDFTTFTIGINSADPFVEIINSPGSRITHIRYACGKLLWWKDGSFGYSVGSDQYDWENVTITQNIGTLDNSSDEYNGHVYFRGQDNHIYDYDCSNVTRLSRKITPTIQASSRRKANSWTQTNQSDFSGGSVTLNGPSLALSTTVFSGDIRPSSFTAIDTSTTDFTLGSMDLGIDTTTVADSFTLRTFIHDTFSNMSKWTEGTGTVDTSGSDANFDEASHLIKSTNTSPSGHWIVQFNISDTATSAQGELFQLCLTTSTGQGTKDGGYVLSIYAKQSSNIHSIFLSTTSAGTSYWDESTPGGYISLASGPLFYISSTTIGTYSGSSHLVKWVRNNITGSMQVYWDGDLKLDITNTAFSSFADAQIYVNQAPGVGHIHLDNLYITSRQGTFTSRTFDTAFSTPVWGTFLAGVSSTGTYTFATRTSANGSSFDSDVSVTTGSVVTSSTKRYLIYSSTLVTTVPDNLPQVSSVTIVSASTGTYYSAVNNASALSSWNTFGVNDQVDGGAITYYVRASTGLFTVNSSTPLWASQSKNSTVSYATGTYMQMRADFSITYATSVLAINDFTFNWFEGNASDKSYIKYFDEKVWVAVSSGTGGTNNRIQMWDILNQTWLLDDIPANGFLIDNNNLYLGSPTSGKIFKFGSVTTDDSSDINSYWKSKDFAGDDPFVQKNWDQSDFVVKQASPTALTVTYQLDGSTSTTSYTMYLFNATKSILHKGANLAGKIGWYYNVMFGDDSSNEAWEVLGYRAKYTPRTWRPE